jgi:hypothetical protein
MSEILDLLLKGDGFSQFLSEMLGFICLTKLTYTSKFCFWGDHALEWYKYLAYDDEEVDWGILQRGQPWIRWIDKHDVEKSVMLSFDSKLPKGVVFFARDGNYCSSCSVRHKGVYEDPATLYMFTKVLFMRCDHHFGAGSFWSCNS